MVLSYHPMLRGDRKRLCAGRDPGEVDLRLMRQATAILLPQGCRESLYQAARASTARLFPDYTCRFAYPGKTGDIRMFRCYGVAHPRSWVFSSVSSCPASFWLQIPYPAVVKGSHGGEGNQVFLASGPHEVRPIVDLLGSIERGGFGGFVVQELVPTDGRDLRVVVIGNRFMSYWRVQPDQANFLHNLAQGARVDADSDPHLQEAGVTAVADLCRRTGINLAGFDLLFPCRNGTVSDRPLFLEVNYYFGRTGLGGAKRFYKLLQEAAREWLAGL
jgi:ribosomal protein S6--L-glutamate ligase